MSRDIHNLRRGGGAPCVTTETSFPLSRTVPRPQHNSTRPLTAAWERKHTQVRYNGKGAGQSPTRPRGSPQPSDTAVTPDGGDGALCSDPQGKEGRREGERGRDRGKPRPRPTGARGSGTRRRLIAVEQLASAVTHGNESGKTKTAEGRGEMQTEAARAWEDGLEPDAAGRALAGLTQQGTDNADNALRTRPLTRWKSSRGSANADEIKRST